MQRLSPDLFWTGSVNAVSSTGGGATGTGSSSNDESEVEELRNTVRGDRSGLALHTGPA